MSDNSMAFTLGLLIGALGGMSGTILFLSYMIANGYIVFK